MTPDDPELLNGIAYQYAGLDMPEKARPYYEKALGNDPEFDRARINVFRLCLQTKDWEEALTHLAYLIAKYPAEAQLYFEMGALHAQMGDMDKAVIAYRRALELDPNLDEARNKLQTLAPDSGTVE